MLIVDSQIHIAEDGRGSWSDLPPEGLSRSEREDESRSNRRHPELADILREMDRVGVDAAVLIPLPRLSAAEDNVVAIMAAKKYPKRFGVMARIDEDRRESIGLLDEFSKQSEVLGLRVSIHSRHHGGKGNLELLTEGVADWLWAACEERGIPVMLFAPDLPNEIGRVAKSHPALHLIVDHLGLDIHHHVDDISDLVRPILSLAAHENIAVKASSLCTNVTESYPFSLLGASLKEVVDVYGSKRVFWGSDISRIPCRYETLLKFFTDELDFLSEEERADILGRGLVNWLGWEALKTP